MRSILLLNVLLEHFNGGSANLNSEKVSQQRMWGDHFFDCFLLRGLSQNLINLLSGFATVSGAWEGDKSWLTFKALFYSRK